MESDELTHVSFGVNNTHLACASKRGVQVLKCQPFQQAFILVSKEENGIIISEIQDINTIWYVKAGNPEYVNILKQTTHKSKKFQFKIQPLAIKLCNEFCAVVFPDFVRLFKEYGSIRNTIRTIYNPTGICALATGYVLATLGVTEGEVLIHTPQDNNSHPLSIRAHEAPINSLALSQDGYLVATSSTKGTLIRIFKTRDGEKVQELRRGKDTAVIMSLAFSQDSRWLVVTSDKQTVHVFSLNIMLTSVSNPVSSLSLIRGVLPRYFSSEWSFAQFHLPPKKTRAVAVFASDEPYTVLVACYDRRLQFDPAKGGEMTQIAVF